MNEAKTSALFEHKRAENRRFNVVFGAVIFLQCMALALAWMWVPSTWRGSLAGVAVFAGLGLVAVLVTGLCVVSRQKHGRCLAAFQACEGTMVAQRGQLERQHTQLEAQSDELRRSRDWAMRASVISEANFEVGFQHAPIGAAITDARGQFERVNDALLQMLNLSEEELTKLNIDDVLYPEDSDIHNGTKSAQAVRWNATLADDCRLLRRNKDGKGEVVWVRLYIALLTEPDQPRPRGFFLQFENITERKQTQLELTRRALYDSLTGLPNRTLFLDRLDAALARGRQRGHRVALLFLDLDQFKFINDSLGHAVGDQLLIRVAERLQSALREADTVTRLGGDEFAVLLEMDPDPVDPKAIAERILRDFAEPFDLDDRKVSTSVSVGIAEAVDCDESAADLLRHADAAMYQAKESGRAAACEFDEATRTKLLVRYETSDALSQAIPNDALELYYQPEIDMRDGKITGVEALVRWTHPDRGLLTAGSFVDIAEQTGLISRIGDWVLREAFLQAAQWQPPGGPIHTRINVASHQLARGDLIARVRELLDETSLAPELICLEMTESALIEYGESTQRTLRELAELGVKMAIDDFGTGYSSLTYLKQIPAHTLKVDQSFVKGISDDKRDRAIVRSVIQLGTELGFDIVAEGVEMSAQRDFLLQHGCTRAQGYLFSRPLPKAKAAQLVRKGSIAHPVFKA